MNSLNSHTVPGQLQKTFDAWKIASRPKQGAFAWNPRTWIKRFEKTSTQQLNSVDLVAAVESIREACAEKNPDAPDRIDRDLVASLSSASAICTEDPTEHNQRMVTAFIASMIWGYGQTGYGPYRTARVLTTDPQAVDHLREVARCAHNPERGGLAAFELIASERSKNPMYLKYLGPAFGTKFLFFLTRSNDKTSTTPVMDAVVQTWFSSHAKDYGPLKVAFWHPASYRRYLTALDTWADALSVGDSPVSRENVELLVFTSRNVEKYRRWPGSDPIETDALSIETLLDILASETDGLRDTKGNRGMELIEELQDWFAGDT